MTYRIRDIAMDLELWEVNDSYSRCLALRRYPSNSWRHLHPALTEFTPEHMARWESSLRDISQEEAAMILIGARPFDSPEPS